QRSRWHFRATDGNPYCGGMTVGSTSGYVLALATGLLLLPQTTAQDVQWMPPPAGVKVDFSRDIEPIFRERCQSCHGPKVQSGGLRLDTRAGAMAGGHSGPVIKIGRSAESRLIQLADGLQKGLVMPVGGPQLTPAQIAVLRD